uniref:Uncharacterized protein n=1 Tax=Arundo donax TaxID=35708 RepID=A0A0A9FTF2_ARUDO
MDVPCEHLQSSQSPSSTTWFARNLLVQNVIQCCIVAPLTYACA